MIVRKTYCGKELLFSDSDADLIDKFTFTYNKGLKFVLTKNNDTGVKLSIYTILFGETTLKIKTMHLNGNQFDFQRENLKRVKKSDWYRFRGPMGEKKHKGVVDYGDYLIAEVCFSGNRNIRIKSHWYNEEYVAGIYNAMCDYLKIEGYRNPVPKIELTVEQKVCLDNKYAIIKEKAKNEKPL